jgi:hypothetical protein
VCGGVFVVNRWSDGHISCVEFQQRVQSWGGMLNYEFFLIFVYNQVVLLEHIENICLVYFVGSFGRIRNLLSARNEMAF